MQIVNIMLISISIIGIFCLSFNVISVFGILILSGLSSNLLFFCAMLFIAKSELYSVIYSTLIFYIMLLYVLFLFVILKSILGKVFYTLFSVIVGVFPSIILIQKFFIVSIASSSLTTSLLIIIILFPWFFQLRVAKILISLNYF